MYNNHRKDRTDRKKELRRHCGIVLFTLTLALGAAFLYFTANSSQDTQRIKSENKVINENKEALEKEEEQKEAETVEANAVALSMWNHILVNPWNKLPENFTVDLQQLDDGQAIDKSAYPDLQAMMDDAHAQGLSPMICSSYRAPEKQEYLFDDKIKRCEEQGYSKDEACKVAATWVALPGTSEHQTGLALDIVSSNNQTLEKEQENTPEQQWLINNSYKYGFILRYPSDKSNITGISYEPWHYRYVGREAAKIIHDRGICLEEYLDSLKSVSKQN